MGFIPSDYRTVVFCVLSGITVGLPLGAMDPFHLLGYCPAPEWLQMLLFLIYLSALLLLPVWTLATLRRRRGFLWGGLLLFVIVFIFIAWPRF